MNVDMKSLARLGAQARLGELTAEEAVFTDLSTASGA
jgi:hypothetical protein